jgi:hypothetical protein
LIKPSARSLSGFQDELCVNLFAPALLGGRSPISGGVRLLEKREDHQLSTAKF